LEFVFAEIIQEFVEDGDVKSEVLFVGVSIENSFSTLQSLLEALHNSMFVSLKSQSIPIFPY